MFFSPDEVGPNVPPNPMDSLKNHTGGSSLVLIKTEANDVHHEEWLTGLFGDAFSFFREYARRHEACWQAR